MQIHDWELLPHFLAVARAGSLRAASQLIGANYGTVNRSIQTLEASYGVRLFHRSKRGFALTEFGEELLPLAEEAEHKVISARKRIEGLDRSETGTIRFSLSPTLAYDVVAPIISKFCEKYPDIDVEVRLTTAVESIPNDETDISLRAANEIKDDVVVRKLFQLKIGIYASESYIKHVLAKAGKDGENLTWIGHPDENHMENWLSKTQFLKAATRHVVADGYMRIRMIQGGVGISDMPTLFEQYYPDLRRLPGTDLRPGPFLWIALHSDLRKTVRVRRFVDFLSDEFLALRPR